MGKVVITEPGHPIPGVYAVEDDVEYTYCDACGSFNIEVKQHPRTPIAALASVVGVWVMIIAAGYCAFALLFAQNWILACIIGLAGILLGLIGVPKTYLKCRKCGNEQITKQNTRNFGGNDTVIIDVSDDLVIKHTIQSRVY